jgi:D-hexose-6-phosphate mutarotase
MNEFSIPGKVSFSSGNGGLPKVDLLSPWSTAEVYLHGAHVTAFQNKDGAPLLFMSRLSPFTAGKAIRGGIPICYPWFGPKEGDVSHGFARITEWKVIATRATETESVLALALPETGAKAKWPPFHTEFAVAAGRKLTMELRTTNLSDGILELEECLHSYLFVAEARDISIRGLESAYYLDKTDGNKRKLEGTRPLRLRGETNRTYLDTTSAVEVLDPGNHRRIHVEKEGSASTVLWNPWTTQRLPDMALEEHAQMVCVESGNVGANRRVLGPGESGSLKVTLHATSV